MNHDDEWTGFYLGLQRAGNMKMPFPLSDEGARVFNTLRKMIDAEMEATKARMSPKAAARL